MNACDICGCEWNPSLQEHRRGVDCASRIHSEAIRDHALLVRVKEVLDDYVEGEKLKDESVLKAFSELRDEIQKVDNRLNDLAKRVNQIENPGMKRVRSMPDYKKG